MMSLCALLLHLLLHRKSTCLREELGTVVMLDSNQSAGQAHP